MLLCERCGYVLDGSPRDGLCPECGRPVRDSLPEYRPGTPWQQKPSVKAWWQTNVLMMVRTRATFESLSVPVSERVLGRSLGLSICNCGSAVAPLLLITPVHAWLGLGLFVAAAIVLLLLTEVEALGLRFIARRRGWRVSWRLARVICAHASIGWAALFPFAVLSWFFFVFAQIAFGVPSWSEWLFVANLVIWLLPPMLFFETLAYLGVRACKYANADTPTPSTTQREQSPRP